MNISRFFLLLFEIGKKERAEESDDGSQCTKAIKFLKKLKN